MSHPAHTAERGALQQPYAVFETRHWQPPMNIYETDAAIVVHVELAGMDPAQLSLEVEPSRLMLSGTRTLRVPSGLQRVQRMEIASGPFQAVLRLARPIDTTGVEAQYADGLLVLQLPFARPVVQRVPVSSCAKGGPQ